MHLTPSDPDIATLYRKIKNKRLDLQPNFQRGEVWGKGKKQRLIDSILRGWHIPPIHVIQSPTSEKQEVLDGQQRLAAIRDFMEGEFSINGSQDPTDKKILELDGASWEDLPIDIQGQIEDFTIRVLTISDYEPGEPGELFYRLNQPTNLTSAEQRNAFFGEARQQVKDLSEKMSELGFGRETLGFSNSRMAYDDVISKFLITVELGTLKKKITANTVTARYRESRGFEGSHLHEAERSLETLIDCVDNAPTKIKLNKASFLSWLLFIHRYNKKLKIEHDLISFFSHFESIKNGISKNSNPSLIPKGFTKSFLNNLLEIYQDRSSSRVADTSSVVLRDLVLWVFFISENPKYSLADKRLKELKNKAYYLSTENNAHTLEKSIEKIGDDLEWGASI